MKTGTRVTLNVAGAYQAPRVVDAVVTRDDGKAYVWVSYEGAPQAEVLVRRSEVSERA